MGFLDTFLGKTWKKDGNKPAAKFDPYASTDFSRRASDAPNSIKPAKPEVSPQAGGFDPYAIDNFLAGASNAVKPAKPAASPQVSGFDPYAADNFMTGAQAPQRPQPQPNMSGYESAYSDNAFTPLDNPDRGTAWWGDGSELSEPNQGTGRWGLVGANTANERYLAMARDHGVSDEDISAWMSGDADYGHMLDTDTAADQPNSYWDGGTLGAPDPVNLVGVIRSEVDDGTAWDYEHLTSPYMTGRQYRYYVNQGMGGLPPEQIVDDAIYTKEDEMRENGFQPFTPTYAIALGDAGQMLTEAPYRLGQNITHAREAIGFGYKIRKDGIEIDGRTFDREAPAYVSQISSDLNDYVAPPARDVPYSTLVREWRVPGEYGDHDGYHYGQWTADPTTRTLEFEDGTTVTLDPVQWTRILGGPGYDSEGLSYRLVDVGQAAHEIDPTQFEQGQVFYIPDLVMSDGTRLNYSQVNSIYFDRDPNDTSEDGISYESHAWQPLPSRLLSGEPVLDASETTDEDGMALPSWLPGLGNMRLNRNFNPWNVLDWTLGSVPIMLGPASWVYSLSSASPARYGFDTASYDPTEHTYNYLSGGYDDDGNLVFGAYVPNPDPETREEQPYVIDPRYTEELRALNVLGNITVPLTEELAGNVGPQFLRGRWDDALEQGATRGQALAHRARGTLAEAGEEIVGNPFEELSRYGISGFYANPLRRDGEIVYDPMGHEIRDLTTSPNDRWANALNAADIANAAIGGAGVSALLGFPGFVRDVQRPSGRQATPQQAATEGRDPAAAYEGTSDADSHIRQSTPLHPNELDAYERYLANIYNERTE